MSMHASSDPQDLLSLARAGNSTAWGQLLEQYRPYLALLARLQIGRKLQGKVDAADLVQDTFLQAHRYRDQFSGTTETELLKWLRQILASRLAKLVRRYCGTQGRNIRLEEALAGELEQSSRVMDQGLVASQSSPSHQAARREQAVLLAEALAQLPAHYREVIILRHLEELSFAEVGRRMGRTENSAIKLWQRALPRLCRLLGGTACTL
jgi:RNA polymerase sigma-70 factor (ECF subfamily)